jgi:hypothetical protein
LCQAALESTSRSTGDVTAGQEAGAAAVPAGAPGVIRTREDAIRMLDRVCEYMERTEPASPAPLLIRRAQRLMNKSFVEIIEDLTPDSVVAIKALEASKTSLREVTGEWCGHTQRACRTHAEIVILRRLPWPRRAVRSSLQGIVPGD